MSDIKTLKEIAEYNRELYRAGHISREEAKNKIEPYLEECNNKARELAKKFNQKPKKMEFISYVR
jgi:polyhydroxyalkanoate synthesis regulator phasin